MAGTRAHSTDATPIPLEERLEYEADRLYALYEEIARAYDRAKKHGLTVDVIAKRLGKDKSQISRLLRGRKNPTVRSISSLALAMECHLVVILKQEGEIPTANYTFSPAESPEGQFLTRSNPSTDIDVGNVERPFTKRSSHLRPVA